jgi:hypothetical protein
MGGTDHKATGFPETAYCRATVPENQLFIVVTPQELPALIAHGKLGELEELSYE